MNQELKDSEILLDLFEHDGWKLFIDENQKLFDVLRDNMYIECDSNDLFQQRRGTLGMLNQILVYEVTIKAIHEQLVGGDNDSEDL